MKLDVIDSSKKSIIIHDTVTILNLNSLVRQNFDVDSLNSRLNPYKHELEKAKSINFCNLSSLCYKIKIKYGSSDCLTLVKNLRACLKNINSDLIFVQCEINNYDEVDMKPFDHLYRLQDDTLVVLKPIRDMIRLLGYSDSQLINLYSYKNFEQYLPSDLFEFVPLDSNETRNSYIKIKEALWSMDS